MKELVHDFRCCEISWFECVPSGFLFNRLPKSVRKKALNLCSLHCFITCPWCKYKEQRLSVSLNVYLVSSLSAHGWCVFSVHFKPFVTKDICGTRDQKDWVISQECTACFDVGSASLISSEQKEVVWEERISTSHSDVGTSTRSSSNYRSRGLNSDISCADCINVKGLLWAVSNVLFYSVVLWSRLFCPIGWSVCCCPPLSRSDRFLSWDVPTHPSLLWVAHCAFTRVWCTIIDISWSPITALRQWGKHLSAGQNKDPVIQADIQGF